MTDKTKSVNLKQHIKNLQKELEDYYKESFNKTIDIESGEVYVSFYKGMLMGLVHETENAPEGDFKRLKEVQLVLGNMIIQVLERQVNLEKLLKEALKL